MKNKLEHLILTGAAIGCLLSFSIILPAQETIVLKDKEDKSPIVNAKLIVYCAKEIFEAFSDSLGRVTIPDCNSNVNYSIQSVEYSETGTWKKYPKIWLMERKTIDLEEALILTLPNDGFETLLLKPRVFPGALQKIELKKIQNFNGSSLSNALNSIPGLRFDERGQGGSRRLNIRGNFTRSAFGVRSLPLYLDEVPLTGPEGSTPLEIVDQEFLSSFQVDKGISRAEHGSANGGALVLHSSRSNILSSAIETSANVGSNGYLRQHSGFHYAGLKSFVVFRQINQQLEGYREQESNQKSQYFLNLGHTFENNSSLQFLNIYYNGKWDLPGSLNATEVAENPTQARAYSKAANASVSKTYLLNALTFHSNNIKKISHISSVFLNINDKLNPYGTSPFFSGYKDENSVAYGLRSNVKYRINQVHEFQFGTEIQTESGDYLEYTNVGGVPEDLKYHNETTFLYQNSYLSYKFKYQKYTVEVSGTHKYYQIDNKGFSNTLDTSLNSQKNYRPEYLGSIELTRQLFWNSNAFVLLRQGNSFPGLFELVDVETGYINEKLNPEKGLNLEIGIKGIAKEEKLNYQFSAYSYSLSESILPGVDDLERLSYYNGNEARYFGIESSILSHLKLKQLNTELIIEFTGALQRYYSEKSLQNLVPGVPLATGTIGLFLKHKKGFEMNVLHRYTDQLPLRDDNELYLAANHLLNIDFQWTKTLGNFNFALSAGINNVLNTSYTSFPQLNATLGRYYNPGPSINYFTGIRLVYRFKVKPKE